MPITIHLDNYSSCRIHQAAVTSAVLRALQTTRGIGGWTFRVENGPRWLDDPQELVQGFVLKETVILIDVHHGFG